jgi:hypothetical protein
MVRLLERDETIVAIYLTFVFAWIFVGVCRKSDEAIGAMD